jgi:hypothetical protein
MRIRKIQEEPINLRLPANSSDNFAYVILFNATDGEEDLGFDFDGFTGEFVIKRNPNSPVEVEGTATLSNVTVDGVTYGQALLETESPIPKGVNWYQLQITYPDGFKRTFLQDYFDTQTGLL